MPTGALTEYVDVAQVMLYVFWVFFFFLVLYLNRESKREGYPLEPDPAQMFGGRTADRQFTPASYAPKVFELPHGGTSESNRVDDIEVAAQPVAGWPGAPLNPTGAKPMLDNIGPAAYALRADVPDKMHDGSAKIVPLRLLPSFAVASQSVNPIGMTVTGADRRPAGMVIDCWVDQMESLVRYYEVSVKGRERNVLLPVNFADVKARQGIVHVDMVHAAHFADVPTTKSPVQVTLLEEEKICAYFGGGILYADARRAEPLI